MKKKIYSLTPVNQVDFDRLVQGRSGQAVVLGLDVGKETIVAMPRWGEGDLDKPWRIRQPSELAVFVRLVQRLSEGRSLRIGMEPTGTYGDPLRQALAEAKLDVQRVSTKASHDFAEVYDNVPSQHDGKDAAVVAELVALHKCRLWPFAADDAWRSELGYWVDRLESALAGQQRLASRLEGLLARHWPEVGGVLKLTSATLLKLLVRYGGPREWAAEAEAAEQVRRWSFGSLKAETIAKLLESSRASVGVRLEAWSRRQLQELGQEGLAWRRQRREAVQELERLSQKHAGLKAQAKVVGSATACVLWWYLGDPRGYDSAGAYRKAMGLNLTERSSGTYRGQLRISKRGHPPVRRWLYLAALRWTLREPVKRWYEGKRGPRGPGYSGRRAAVAVMRKLALGLHAVGVTGEVFVAEQLFADPKKAEAKPGEKSRRQRRRRRQGRRRGGPALAGESR